jgi:iron complex transport system substrate-binding protein
MYSSLEWIKFFGAFYNRDAEAERIFEDYIARLEELQAKLAEIPDSERPTVAYGMVWEGTVYTQAGDSSLAVAIEQAGGKYALPDLTGGGSVTLTMEEFVDKCRDADILIYGSMAEYMPDKAALIAADPLFAEFKAVQSGDVYVFSKGYYMNGAKVIEKFEDQAAIFQPSLMPNHSFIFYSKLPE